MLTAHQLPADTHLREISPRRAPTNTVGSLRRRSELGATRTTPGRTGTQFQATESDEAGTSKAQGFLQHKQPFVSGRKTSPEVLQACTVPSAAAAGARLGFCTAPAVPAPLPQAPGAGSLAIKVISPGSCRPKPALCSHTRTPQAHSLTAPGARPQAGKEGAGGIPRGMRDAGGIAEGF